MTLAPYATLLSAALGAAGTLLLFFGSYALEPREGAAWGGPEVDAWNARVKERNRRRKQQQRAGLALLCLSFLVQIAAVFL